jgi:hypothetical protein
MASLLDMAQARLQGLLDLPARAGRALVDPTVFSGLLGAPTLPKERGIAQAAYGLPPEPNMSVLNPEQAAYMQGYAQGEPLSYLGLLAPFTAPAAVAGAKAVAPQAGMALENYMARQGLVQNIVPVDVAKSIKMPTTLPTDDVFRKAVENTPGATVTDEGLVMSLMRKQKPQQAETESVRGGVFYLPEGSASMKHYGGTNYYGGTEKISGETLYKNPLVVKGATGGKAPEMAYEQLAGKDGYKAMQEDVQKAAFSGSQNMRKDLVEQFLGNYAPDLSGYGSYIISNSKQGNQLRYALQEAAVAQKARDSGYDAVIGYSKKKSGDPFLSEVFDVREAIYPSTQGDYRLMDKFEGLLD